MRYRKLGHTNIDVSVICLGSMIWGKQNTEAEGHEQLDYALEHGVNFIDTAEMYSVPVSEETYGATERIIGTWYAADPSRREKTILATKVTGPSGFSYMRPHLHDGRTRLDRQSIIEACEESLKRLQTDYIDVYQLHWPDRNTNNFDQLGYSHDPRADETPTEESLRALEELVKAGKIRYAAVSNETPWGIMEFLRLAEKEGLPRIVSIQNPYNLLKRDYEVGMAEISCREEIGLLAYSPLAMGVLSGKYLDGKRPEGARMTLFGDYFPRYMSERAQQESRKYVDIARKHGLDPAEMANAYVNGRPFLTSNIIGARTMDQLKSAVASGDMDLSQDVLDEIEAVHKANPIGY